MVTVKQRIWAKSSSRTKGRNRYVLEQLASFAALFLEFSLFNQVTSSTQNSKASRLVED
jgi:hypothetical protein